MKIFVAYGFNGCDRWVEQMVFPIIRAFDIEVVTGEDLNGELITEAIRERIRKSDALIGFATRRAPEGADTHTHRWVTDEIAHAHALSIPFVEVRELGVDEQRGSAGDRQPIYYDELHRDRCLVELVKTIGEWRRSAKIRLQLLPDECADEILPMLEDARFRCTYRILDGEGEISEAQVAKVVPVRPGGLIIHAAGVPRQSAIQIRIECMAHCWISDFESTDTKGVHLRRG